MNVDIKGNIGNIVFSTYKRKASGFTDDDRIMAFDAFVTGLSPANVPIVVHSTVATATATTATVAKPTIPSGATAPMQNMAAATTLVAATDFN